MQLKQAAIAKREDVDELIHGSQVTDVEEVGYDIGQDCRVTIQDPEADAPQPGQEGLWRLDKDQTCIVIKREDPQDEKCHELKEGVCEASATIVFNANPGESRLLPASGADAVASAWVFYYLKSSITNFRGKVNIQLGWKIGDAIDAQPLVTIQKLF